MSDDPSIHRLMSRPSSAVYHLVQGNDQTGLCGRLARVSTATAKADRLRLCKFCLRYAPEGNR